MKRFFSKLLFIFLGLPLVLSSVMLLSVRPWALDRDFYKHLINDDRLYAILRSSDMAKDADARMELGGSVFAGPELLAALQKRIPETELKALGNQAVDRAIDLAEGKARGGLELDLKPLKAALKKAAPGTVDDYLRAIPETKETLKPGDLTARPASIPLPLLAKSAEAALVNAADAIPDKTGDPNATIRVESGVGLAGQAALNRATATATALAALLVAGLATMGGGGLAAILARAGRMIGGPSAFAIILGALFWLPGASFLEKLLPPEARTLLSTEAVAALRAYFASALGTMAKSFFLTGLIGASLGGLLGSAKKILQPKEIEED